ncbi:bifunctional alpha,alpha-trehalose-phosphate synthase (UDP-forming)/trehalose-phosphatase [Flavobacteriaceae bacterium]|nr:bifunctional alpha,alpha-trehalose-phosphate synthase (UDP-forming)/trehalose-phosphatase [Flavobacteriaceae bacterium]MDA8948133.1 bifunctional alpha,alpha-trehalose-phosphate synthase (UDP-forming)/trehalose-phosphatase [Flavobacteriaceae bacterium]MDA9015486.1 bifunctional alpha,alpha-trehalose-phosphate synthase (UDP-forming)/trehalose-phosphatase [Flavobacteriaceae bacterium]MDC3354182.1 bifunctional alpha,alpha-trehalose-phosphate synthase (UDP-forming)/trehalose-phosphatase [Flavobacte
MSKNIIVSNRLPVQAQKADESWSFIPTSGGLATGMKSVHQEGDSLWVGWPGVSSNVLDTKSKLQISNDLEKYQYRPVFLDDEELDNFYFGFSNKCLWPLFHYFIEYHYFDTKQWEYYIQVNQKFANEVLEVIEDGDIVWIHDYQLMLCPQMIKDVKPEVTIGFFLHIPFPSFEIFRIFPERERLLNGLLGADVIGFHTYDYERHFLSSVKRILNFEVNFNIILHHGREIVVNTFPMGIDFKKFEAAALENIKNDVAESSELKKQINAHKSKNEGKLILSIDRLDYTKGVVNRLLAFERFLDTYPEYHDKIRLVMLAVPSRSKVSQYKQLKRQTDEVVGRINGKFASVNWTPVWYYYRSMKFENLIDLYVSSDVAMITPLRDGMNLVAKEYLATRVANDGVLILSELAGSSKELPQALLVNPFDIEQLSQSIKTALEMPVNEQKERNIISRKRLERYDIDKWSSNFMKALNEVSNKESSYQVKLVNTQITNTLTEAYKEAKKRLLLLDYDGTLVGFHENPNKATPPITLLSLLERLSNQRDTDVVIISGRSHEFLEQHFAHLNLTLVAEHGLFLKLANAKWEEKKGVSSEWKEHLLPVLDTFTDNTPGTFIEHKKNSLVWHYRKADPELGIARSVELKTVLASLLSNDLTLLDGNKVVELVPANINKGIVALDIFNSKKYDFILVAGDDVTDENMFTNLPVEAFKVKIGKKKTAAEYYTRNYLSLLSLLNKFL